jgi:lipopolysaccharide export LptBFGC system permease protein LptF
MVWTLGPEGALREIESARRAVLKDRVWSLEDGATAYLDAHGALARVERYTRKPILLSRALQNYYAEKRTPLEMSANELVALARTLEETGQSSQRLRVHLAFKYSIPAACLVLALIAAPLADRFAHLGSFAGLVVAIGLVFLYNGVRSWGLALGLAGVLPPAVAGWAQNVIFGGLGLALLIRHR